MNIVLSKTQLKAVASSHERGGLVNNTQGQAAAIYIENNELPTSKHEDWLKTDITRLLKERYVATVPIEIDTDLLETYIMEVDPHQVEGYTIDGLDANIVVFVNGYFDPKLSTILSPIEQLHVGSTRTVNGEHANLRDKHHCQKEENVFTALNTAYAPDGCLIHVPKNTTVDRPIHIMQIGNAIYAPALMQVRNLIVVETNAKVQIIETYHSISQNRLFTNTVNCINLEAGAQVDYSLFQNLQKHDYMLHHTRVQQASNSSFIANTVSVRGALIRNNIRIEHKGQHVETELNGLYLADGKQHVDNHIDVNHAQPNCNSKQFYRGILDNTASAVFTGKVYVARDAQKTKASQSNKNILLTDTAKVSSKPQLEIYADDVECAHGSSTGQLDDDAMFYMMQRGLSKQAATAFLLFAFVADVVNRVKLEPLRKYIDKFVNQRLGGE